MGTIEPVVVQWHRSDNDLGRGVGRGKWNSRGERTLIRGILTYIFLICYTILSFHGVKWQIFIVGRVALSSVMNMFELVGGKGVSIFNDLGPDRILQFCNCKMDSFFFFFSL